MRSTGWKWVAKEKKKSPTVSGRGKGLGKGKNYESGVTIERRKGVRDAVLEIITT